MLIAVAANGPHVEGEIQHHAGRAPYYLLFDTSGDLVTSLANPYHDAERAVAPKVAALLADKGVGVLVAGNFGHRLEIELNERKIDFVQQAGTITSYLTGLRSS